MAMDFTQISLWRKIFNSQGATASEVIQFSRRAAKGARRVIVGESFWRSAALYGAAVVCPLGLIVASLRLGIPSFVFEHLTLLLVVGAALGGGVAPAIVLAITASFGDNVLLREPVGRPTITGTRDVIDLGLSVIVAATVSWLVNRLRIAKEQALSAAEREHAAREERDRIVSTLIHDLATPLGAIEGTVRFVRRRNSTSELDLPRILMRLETAAHRASTLIRTLVDSEALKSDSLALQTRSVDLREVVEPIARMLDKVSERHPVALAIHPLPVVVECDPERVQRVAENLIMNAIKYSPEGGSVEVELSLDGHDALLTVRDYGIGIAADARSRVFEWGYRQDGAHRVAHGLGVGLYISSEIVRRHGGTIKVTAPPPRGTMFAIRLPLASAPE